MKVLIFFISFCKITSVVTNYTECQIKNLTPPLVCYAPFEQNDVAVTFTENFELVTKVTFSAYQISESKIPDDLGASFPNLKTFDAKLYGVKSIKKEDFDQMNHLETLDLGYNRITELPEDVFSRLTELSHLELSANDFKVLPECLLASNTKLRIFILMFHQVKTLPEKFFSENVNLDYVYIEYGPLLVIQVDFTSLLKVELLSLKDNICLSRTYVKDESDLQEFQIFINENCKPGTPHILAAKRAKCQLNSSQKPFVCTEISFQDMEEIETFDDHFDLVLKIVFGSVVDEFPLDLSSSFPNVKEIVFNFNLENLEEEHFANMKKLETLDLSYNKISNLRENLFSGLVNLKIFDLSSNDNIIALPEKLLLFNENLEAFFMDYHKIKILPKNFFATNLKLKEVSMTNGLLEIISVDFTVFQSDSYISK